MHKVQNRHENNCLYLKNLFWSHLTGRVILQSRTCSINNSSGRYMQLFQKTKKIQYKQMTFSLKNFYNQQCHEQCLKQALLSILLSTNSHLKFVLSLYIS